ncbi:GRASP [Branchiostoma lanceolatum]|uniref:GRASP protein n=1 Tax=Branchiostoma lanceolatum TaxID=7740 RepID=A0A8J9Z9U0_BRALA|nr:GRASP [Branchiostoma lanceolatum]
MREKGRHTKGITLHIVPVDRRRCSPTETESSTALLTGGGDTSHRRIALEATMESGVMAKVGRSIFYYSEPEISDGSRANSAESLCSDDSSLSANEPVAGVSTGSLPCRSHHGRERFIAVPGPDGVTLAQLTHSGFLKAFPQNPLNRRGSEDMLSKDKDSDTESCNSGVAPTAPSKRTSIPRRSSTGSYEMSTARRKLVAARQKLGRKATGSFRSTADKTSQSDAKHGDLKRSLSPQLGRYIKSYLLRQGSPKHAILRASHIHATSEADVKPPMNQRRLVALRRDPIIGYGFQLQSFSFHTECGSLQYATYVNKVIPDGPGHVGGLQPGDVIMEVDNTNVEREGAKSITEMIRRTGPAVRLTVVFMDAVRRVRLQRRLEELKSDLCTKKLELMDLVEKERELTGKLSPGSHHGSPTKDLSPSKSPAGQGFVRESHVERSPNRTSHVQKSPSRSSQDSSDLSPDYVEITGSQDDVFSSHLGSTSGVPGSSATLPPSGRSDVAGSSGRSRRVSSDRDSVYGEELKQLKAVLQHFESLQRYKEEKIASNNHGDHTKENPHSGTWPRQQSPASRHRLSREKKRDPSPNHTDSCPTTYDRRRHHSRRESLESSGANSAENSVVAVSAPESPQGRLSRQNSLEKEKELEGHLHALRRKHKSGRLSAKSSDEVYV